VARQYGPGVSAAGLRGSGRRWQRAVQLTAVVAAGALLTAACGGSSGAKTAVSPVANGQSQSSTGASASASSSAPGLSAVLTAKPANGTKNADPSQGLQISVANGKIESVTAQDANGKSVAGALSGDSTSWSSTGTLLISSSYTVTAKALGGDGQEKTTTTKFTTLTPAKRVGLDHYVPDNGMTVGVGEPIAVFFTHAPSTSARAAVEKAMTVTTTPHVDGAWSWRSSTQADWRPESYWTTGTKVAVHLGLNGVKAGDSTYGSFTKDFSFTIGAATISTVDLLKDTMTVTQNGTVVKTIPVSGGMAKHQTWSGKMVVLDKVAKIHMTSQSVGFTDADDFYSMDIEDAVHLTTSGTYVHAAPWRHASFGKENVSHGCVGMDLAPAQWFYNLSKPGDIVEVLKSSATKGNVTTNPNPGFDDWNLSWDQWLKGSAAGVQS
jgi:lipoprotein-anchoring transpeptidase ErfK/SrfK